ncbi:outer membrane protein, partial [Sphingomonas sp. PR090111-T3T-6A]|uniref:outer membrane protein n=1 Tax=Sphingomonas sp. PR090111-T3T-6A TaxID=685778 RepID=UPI001F2B5788
MADRWVVAGSAGEEINDGYPIVSDMQQVPNMRACADIPHWLGFFCSQTGIDRKGINMRKLALVVALASTALAGPAFAKDKAWYVGVEGGGMIVEDSHYSIAGTSDALKVDQRTGFDVDGIVGYDFGMFRVEGEAAYKRAENSGLTNSVTLDGVAPGNYRNSRTGNTSALSFMVNALLDFGDDKGISGYVGGGAGVARVKADSWRFGADFPDLVDDSDTRFAWQAIAGVRAPVTDKIDVGVKYRFFDVTRVKLTDLNGDQTKGRFRSHSLLASVIFNFGEPAAPPP